MPGSVLLSAASAGLRIASLNLCTDEYLLLLARPEQIASVSHLSQDALESPLWASARRFPANDGTLLSAVRHQPTLVLTMGGGGHDRLAMGQRLGIPVISLPLPQSLPDVENNLRRVARAVGRPDAARPVLDKIARLKRSAPRRQAEAIWLGGGGRTVASHSLDARWMSLAGLRQRPMTGDRVSLETLLVNPPQVLLRSDYRSGQYSAAQRWLSHPLAKRVGQIRNVPTDGRLWTCSGPLLVDEVVRLRRLAW